MNKHFNEIINDLGVCWEPNYEPGKVAEYWAPITDTQLELYTRCVVKLCVDQVLNTRILDSDPAEQFEQWNAALLKAADEVYSLISENQP